MDKKEILQQLRYADYHAEFLRMQLEIVRLCSGIVQRELSEFVSATKKAEAFAVRQQALLDQSRAGVMALLDDD